MTEQEVVEILSQRLDGPPQFVLMKRGLYYRPDAKGYTRWIGEAWHMSEEEADKHVYPHDEPVTKHRVPTPRSDCLNSRDALAPSVESLTTEEWLKVHAILVDKYEIECEKDRSVLPGPWRWLLTLPPREIAFAIAEVLAKEHTAKQKDKHNAS